MMRTIAATFVDAAQALLARSRLESSLHGERVRIAPAVVAETIDGPIDRDRTLVAVTVDGDAPIVRRLLVDAGGLLVADVELEEPPASSAPPAS